MKLYISHDRAEETPESKARWFQSLTLEERMEYLCTMTDLVFENNPGMIRRKNAQQASEGVLVLTKP